MKDLSLNRRRFLTTALGAGALATGPWLLPRGLAAASADTPADPKIRGPYPILTTPFTASGAVDFEVLADEARFVAWGGCAGMIWPQSGDSVDLLTHDEKLQGMEVLAKTTRGLKSALCLGVQGKDTAEMLMFARHAEKLAPAAIISRPPDSGKTEADLREYWRALAVIAKRPVILQTTGGTAYKGPVPSVRLLIELAREFPHFGYVKEEATPIAARIQDLVAAKPPIRRVFSAHGGVAWLYEARLGTEGLITERAVYADVLTRIWDLQQSGSNRAALRDAFSKFILMVNLAGNLPGGTFRGVQLYLWKKRGVFKTLVSRQYGRNNSIPSSPSITDLKMSDAAIGEIEDSFEGLRLHLKEISPDLAPFRRG